MSLVKRLKSWSADFITFIYYLPFYTYCLATSIIDTIVTDFTRQRKSLEGETILVTGAASGIGQKVVWQLAEKFPTATYVLWDINYKGLQQTQEKCNDYGASKVHIYAVDLSSRDKVIQTASQVKRDVGNVTLLYNNAGMGRNASFVDADLDVMELEMRVNFFSHLYTIREFLPDMMKMGKGHIVCTCSGIALFRLSNGGGYIASKYALRGFMESLSLEMKQIFTEPKIKTSIVYPGFVKTPLMETNFTYDSTYNALKPLSPGQAAEQIVDGILKEKSEIFVPSLMGWVEITRLLPALFVDRMFKHSIKNLKFKQL